MNSEDDNSDDEYRKKLGKKVGERGIDVIRVPVDAKLPSSSKRSKKMKKAPKGKKTKRKICIIDALSKSYNGESSGGPAVAILRIWTLMSIRLRFPKRENLRNS